MECVMRASSARIFHDTDVGVVSFSAVSASVMRKSAPSRAARRIFTSCSAHATPSTQADNDFTRPRIWQSGIRVLVFMRVPSSRKSLTTTFCCCKMGRRGTSNVSLSARNIVSPATSIAVRPAICKSKNGVTATSSTLTFSPNVAESPSPARLMAHRCTGGR